MNSILRRTDQTHRSQGDLNPESNRLPELEQLEPRMLFSGTPAPVDAAAAEEVQTATEDSELAAEATVSPVIVSVTGESAERAAISVDAVETIGEGLAGNSTGSGPTEIAAGQSVHLVDLNPDAEQVNRETFEAVIEAAETRWRATGLTAEQSATLDEISYEIRDLEGTELGFADGNRITLDADGAGNLWFIDNTPYQDEEFEFLGEGTTTLVGADGTVAEARYDLLTAILHEQGHILNVPHNSGTGGILMDEVLLTGSRRLPEAGLAEDAEEGDESPYIFALHGGDHTGSTGGSQSLDIRQPYATVNYAIAIQGTFPSRNLSADDPNPDALSAGNEPFLGAIMQFGGNFAPRGWALADGSTLSISTNSALFSILGTTFGGDGQSTFGLPDLRGRVPIGTGTGDGLTEVRLGQKIGAETVTLGSTHLPSHTHGLSGGSTDPTTGGGTSFENRAPGLGLTPVISLQGTFPSRNVSTSLGSVYWFAGNFAPSNYEIADGREIPIASNSALFSILGTTYGGDGQSTFGLPDLRGRTAIHAGNGPGLSDIRLGQKGGTETITLAESTLPGHTHTITGGNTGATGGGQSIDLHQPYLALNYEIALQGVFPSRSLGVEDPPSGGEDPAISGLRAGTELIDLETANQLIGVIVDEGIDRWVEAGISAGQTAQLRSAIYRIEDLDTGILASVSDHNVVSIDADASNAGWFVDSTPEDDQEFLSTDPQTGELLATDAAALNHYDLLTTIMHEQGHLLGLSHAIERGSVMSGMLQVGGRLNPEAVDLVVSGAPDTSTPYLAGAGEDYIAQIGMFAGNFAVRTYALTDGQELSISSNSALFSLLGTTYGGDGQTTFGLPDFRGRAVVGSQNNATGPGLTPYQLGSKGGQEDATLTDAHMPAHDHGLPIPSNTDPSQNANTGLSVNEGSTGNIIGQAALEFTDAEEAATAVTFTLDSVPANGTLKLSGSPLAASGTFTQDDLNNNRVTYDHDGSETTSDSIQFDVTDGAGGATNDATFAFTITAQNDSPAILTNAGLTVSEGGSGTITNTQLNENDPDDSDIGLIYTVTALPGNGSVKRNGTPLVLNGTFTQDDIDNSLVTYQHDGTETTSDSFNFSLADGGENGSTAATGTFALTITPQNDAPAIGTNAGLTLNQGASGTIGNTQLDENDPDDSGTDLTYMVTALPANGSVKLNGTPLVVNGIFTQDDVDNNRVTYQHDGSATTSDSFDFSLADGGENGASAATGTFNITVNDVTPPTPNITGPASPTMDDPFNVTIDFGEAVSDFVQGDVTVTGGSVSSFTDNGGGNFTVGIDATADGAVSVSVAASVATDNGGNNNNVSNTYNVAVDTTGPTPTISGPAGPLTTLDPFDVTVDFGETVSTFVQGEVTAGNGSVTAFTDNGSGNFTVEITPAAGGSVTVNVAAGVADDNAGNGTGAASQYSVTLNLPLGPNTAAVTGTDLEINAGSSGDTVTLTSDGTTLRITTPAGTIAAGSGTSASGNDAPVPVAPLTSITLKTGDDDDDITIGDLTNFTGELIIDGEGGNDNITQTGEVMLTGSSGATFTAERIHMKTGSSLSTDSGDVTMSGTGATGRATGIKLQSADILSNTGDVNLTGQGGDNGHFNRGVDVGKDLLSADGSNIITGGEINLAGTGGTSGVFSSGINISGSSTIRSTGSNPITISGGATSGSIFSEGVVIQTNSIVDAGTGDLTITGIASDTANLSRGVRARNSTLTSDGGDIRIDGTGGGVGILGVGADLDGVNLSTTGAGTVTITGAGAPGQLLNMGVRLSGSNDISSVNGAITIEGTAKGSGTGLINHGVQIMTGQVRSTGSGPIIIRGTGGDTGLSHGVEISTNVNLTVNNGNLSVIGVSGTGSGNKGINLSTNATLKSTGTGHLIVTGTSNGTGNGSAGVVGNGTNFDTTMGSGNITIDGTGGKGTSNNSGVQLSGGSVTTNGVLSLTGRANTAGGTFFNYGVYLLSTPTLSGGAGSLVTGTGNAAAGNHNHGITVSGTLNGNLDPTANFTGTAGTGAASKDKNGTYFA